MSAPRKRARGADEDAQGRGRRARRATSTTGGAAGEVPPPPAPDLDDVSDAELAPDAPLTGGRLRLAPGAPHVGTLTVPTVNAAVLSHGRGTVTTALETALSRLAFPHWPRTSPYRCWHCGEAFTTAPWFVFHEQLPNGEWLVSGNFCMVGCVVSWLMCAAWYAHERTATWIANVVVIWRARRGMAPEDATPVPRAPPPHARLDFGGALTLREYRRQGGYEDVPPECPIVSAVLGPPFISAPSVVQIEEVRGVDAVASAEDAIGAALGAGLAVLTTFACWGNVLLSRLAFDSDAVCAAPRFGALELGVVRLAVVVQWVALVVGVVALTRAAGHPSQQEGPGP